MNDRVDLYVEKLVAKMNLDDAQHDQVAMELRSHLEEAIETAVAAGSARDQAETEALLRFGQPSVIARHFGVLHGTVWLAFEYLAIGLLVYFWFAWQARKGLSPLAANLLALGAAATLPSLGLWRNVIVNGSLRIRRVLRPTVVIPFDAIESVSFEKGHLFGARRIVVKHAKGRAVFSTRFRGARAAAIALQVLCPETVSSEMSNYFRQTVIRARSESTRFRLIMSLLWLALLCVYGAGFHSFWHFTAIPLFVPLSVFLSLPLAFTQAWLHVDRARRGVCWLISVALVIVLSWLVFTSLFGDMEHARRLLLLFPAIGAVALTTLWWRGQRSSMVAMSAALLVLAYVVPRALVHSVVPYRILASEYVRPSQAVALGNEDGKVVYLFEGDSEGYVSPSSPSLSSLLQVSDTTTQLATFATDLSLLSAGTSTALIALHDDSDAMSRPVQFVQVDASGSSSTLVTLSPEVCLGYSSSLAIPWLSPGGRYCFSPVATAKKGDIAIGISETSSGVLRRFDQFRASSAWRWRDDSTLTVVHPEREPGAKRGSPPFVYSVYALDAATSAVTFERKLQFCDGEYGLWQWRSGRYALLSDSDERGIAIGDLETGGCRVLPAKGTGLCWDAANGRVAYLTDSKTPRRFVVADFSGILRECPLPEEFELEGLLLSPDGKRLVTMITRPTPLAFAFKHLVMFDLESAQMHMVDRLSFYPTLFTFLWSAGPNPPTRWSVDGTRFVYPVAKIWYEGRNALPYHEIREVDLKAAGWM